VTVAPFGDAADDEDEEGGERQAVALITTLVSEEEDLSSGAFAAAAQDAAVGFALGSDVVWTVSFSDVLRGELRGGMGMLQAALEQYLGFEEKGLIDTESPAKTLHLVVTDVGEEEGEELGLGKALERHVSAMWRKLIKPAGSVSEVEEEGEEEGGLLAPPGWARVLSLNVVYMPSKAYASSEHARVLSSLKAALDSKLTKTNPFLPASALQSSIANLSSSSSLRSSSLPKADTIISSFYLDKLVARYAAQFQQDSRQLLEELNTGYDDDFGRTFSELIEKYLSDFHQEVYGVDAGPIHTSLQGLDAGQVSAVVKVKKEQLRKALLGLAEEGYVRQLQFLKQMAQEEFRKGISALKYQWELIPGFAKAIKAAKALFVDRAGKLACARSGGKWKATAEKELRSLTKILETQADDVIERTRASGGFVPTKLRRPIGIQVNWLGANFFHFVRDSSVDPLSVRTDSGVALWQNLGETWASRDGKDQRVSARYRQMYGEEIDPMVMDYLLVSPKGVGLNDKDPRVRFGWNRRVAYELVRNHDDMTFQIPHAKAIKDY
jgi:ketosteroid isomerase-like protein